MGVTLLSVKKILLSLVFFTFFFILSFLPALAIDISAESAVLYDPVLDRILYEKNGSEPMPMASTTKLMTALLVLENLPLDQRVTIQKEWLQTEGSSMYLQEGENITIRELLYGLLLSSGNDAAKSLASICSGSEEKFVKLMNVRAAELGMCQTHFENPHGLPAENHYSTAEDLAKLMGYCLKTPSFVEICETQYYVSGVRVLSNHNKLLSLYSQTICGKTGFTKEAGRCLVSAAGDLTTPLIAVTLNAPDDWNDHIALYNDGFSAYPPVNVFSGYKRTISIQSGIATSATISTQQHIQLRLSADELDNLQMVYLYPSFLYAPVEKGSTQGSVLIFYENKEIAEIPLQLEENVGQRSVTKNFFEKCNISFKKFANRLGLW